MYYFLILVLFVLTMVFIHRRCAICKSNLTDYDMNRRGNAVYSLKGSSLPVCRFCAKHNPGEVD